MLQSIIMFDALKDWREQIFNFQHVNIIWLKIRLQQFCIDLSKCNFPNAPQNWVDTSPNHGKPYHIRTFEQLVGHTQSADEYVYVV